MIKIIAADMDGTLLNSKHQLPENIFEIIKKITSKGVIFSIATGRQYESVAKIFKPVINDIMVICENGALVKYRGETIYIDAIKNDELPKIVEHSRKIENADVLLCGSRGAYYESEDSWFLKNMGIYYSKYQKVDDICKVPDFACKVAVFDRGSAKKNAYPKISAFKNDFTVALSGYHWADFMSITANKGNAFKKVMEKYKISPNNAMAFGDYLNDIELVSSCKYSYAMENALPEVKKAANFVTKSNNENGVVFALKKYFDV